jgi:hypothetical protein
VTQMELRAAPPRALQLTLSVNVLGLMSMSSLCTSTQLRFAFTSVVVASSVVQATPVRAQSWRAVDRALSQIVDSPADSVSSKQASQLWTAFDAAIVGALNAHASLDSINRVLSRRPGFQGPSPGQATLHLPNATFWRELPRDAPNYFVAVVDAASATLLAIVQTPFTNGPSHLSVLQKRRGVWQQTSAFSSQRQLSAYRIPTRDTSIFLTTLETWTRADGSESQVKLWRLTRGRLSRITRADTTQFQDADVQQTDTALVVDVSQFPKYVSACTMCTRLAFSYTFTASIRGVHEHRESLNPWALLVDSLYSMAAAHKNVTAKGLLPRRVSLTSLTGKDPEFASDSGDFRIGEGFADISVDALRGCERYWRFRSARQPSGVWKIVDVRPGRWNGRSVVFDDRASRRRLPNGPCS